MSAVAAESRARGEDVEPWELHSELVLVSPEVCRAALEALPERDPDAFLTRSALSAEAPTEVHETAPSFIAALFGHTLWRVGQTARFGLLVVGVLVVLAALAELWH